MNTKYYLLRALTNLHAGSGNESVGTVDLEVQRDVITKLPVINSSGIKGALREHFTNKEVLEPEIVKQIFGHENKEEKPEEFAQGAVSFFSAQLLSLPLRASRNLYCMATSPGIIQHFVNTLELSGDANHKELIVALNRFKNIKTGDQIYSFSEGELYVESEKCEPKGKLSANDYKIVTKYFGENLVLMSDKKMSEFAQRLPVIARNVLDNGISKNLWYEEIVPRESRFVMMTTQPADVNEFLDSKRVQIGANASIGYGLTEITKIGKN